MDLISFSAKETDRLLQLHPSLRSRPYSSNLLLVTTCASYDQSDEIIHAIRLTDDSILRLSRQLYPKVRNFTLTPLFFFLPRLNKTYTLLTEGTDCSTYTYVDQMTAGQQYWAFILSSQNIFTWICDLCQRPESSDSFNSFYSHFDDDETLLDIYNIPSIQLEFSKPDIDAVQSYRQSIQR